MISHLLFQILFSWFVACFILKLFNSAISAPHSEIYREPELLIDFFDFIKINFSVKAKLIASRTLHHIIVLCFITIYYLVWYYEFAEISWEISFIIGILISMVSIIRWIFLIEIIPSARLANFKGYYLQTVFIYNIFTITAFTVYRLFVMVI